MNAKKLERAIAQRTIKSAARDDSSREIPFCTYAPEWAEHARFDRNDDACDDGRAGAS